MWRILIVGEARLCVLWPCPLGRVFFLPSAQVPPPLIAFEGHFLRFILTVGHYHSMMGWRRASGGLVAPAYGLLETFRVVYVRGPA